MNTPTEGRIVSFKPSDRTNKKFEQQKSTYPAIVTQVNENSIDLTVFGVGQTEYVTRVQHTSISPEGRSSWDWPSRD